MNFVASAFCLTALSYGLARFAYGLLLPYIRDDLDLTAAAAGWIGGGAFAAYCLGIAVALLFEVPMGERRVAGLAGLAATLGMFLVSSSQTTWQLGLAIAVAGLSTGLTSPPLAVAVAKGFDQGNRPRANGVINSGTAAGIVVSGVAVLAFPGGWRELYAVFAVLGAVVTVWLWFVMPTTPAIKANVYDQWSINYVFRTGAGRLCTSAFLAGSASTAIWTFGANFMRDEVGFSDRSIALAWIALGIGGSAGAATGLLTDYLGIRFAHRLSVSCMALILVSLVGATVYPPAGFAIMGLFGAAYIVATGTFLMWGIALYEDRPALGLGIPFLILALGQTAGAPLFGAVLDYAGSATALISFAIIMGGAALWSASPGKGGPETILD
ncbi:MFS transporter [Neorhizobium sp. JUb45]|uniref:MFS transporter n=1 Tax=Neorhizobium sp. JUb45 TaxID=2485113 RepID=UPI0010EE9FC5|nr:MFS transporter [Neorhizobium sp. JUb45]TCQ97303.1 putative MFS family arabinose efflux permease [Neorhizobium sp. JUb45]